jgi:transcriptional regulator with XRE-family HTH domain
MERKSMGSFLTALRKTSGMTQKQLAEKLNVSDKAVSRWERDECAPDLSLIPVLAEIYGVTSDEILQGHRIDPEKLYHGGDQAKAVKQRKRILKSTKTKFICRSLITVAVTLMGTILAYILNAEFAKANAGFLLGSIFFIGATVCQILSMVTGFASVTDEEWQDSNVENCKGFMLLTSEWCLGIIGAAIALCIPFAGKDNVTFSDWVFTGIQCLFAVTAVIIIISLTVNHRLKRRGVVDLNQPLNRLQLRSGTALSLILLLLLGMQAGMNQFLNSHKLLYAPYDTYSDLQLFHEVIEEPKTEEGFPMYIHDDDNDVWVFHVEDYDNYECTLNQGSYIGEVYTLHKDEILKELIPTEAENPAGVRSFSKPFGYQFSHLNRSIVHYEVSNTESLLPIRTYTTDHMKEANRIALSINLIYLISYVITLTLALTVYKSKEKKL